MFIHFLITAKMFLEISGINLMSVPLMVSALPKTLIDRQL